MQLIYGLDKFQKYLRRKKYEQRLDMLNKIIDVKKGQAEIQTQ